MEFSMIPLIKFKYDFLLYVKIIKDLFKVDSNFLINLIGYLIMILSKELCYLN